MKLTKIIALALIVAGILGLVYGGVAYTRETLMGSIEMTISQDRTFNIPVSLGVGALVAGGILLFMQPFLRTKREIFYYLYRSYRARQAGCDGFSSMSHMIRRKAPTVAAHPETAEGKLKSPWSKSSQDGRPGLSSNTTLNSVHLLGGGQHLADIPVKENT